MSATQRARRSTSRTAPDTDGDLAQSTGTSPISNPDLPDPSSAPSPSHLAASTGLPRLNSEIPETNEATMLSTLTASALIAAEPHNLKDAKDGFDDHADNRSSSLSELGDASDEHSEPTPRPSTAVDLNENENDSEAETERLENTPRKLTRTATETSLASEQLYQRTPSKLAQSRTIDQEESAPPTPSITAEDAATIPDAADGTTALQALSIAATTEADNLAELAGRKRKRSSADNSSLEEQADEPARKRSGTAKDSTLNCDREGVVDSSAQADAEEELEIAEERISQLAQEEVELEVRQAEIAVEAVNELTTVAKHAKPRKGGRRGKRKVEDMAHSAEALSSIEGHEGEGDGDNEEEDSGAVDEEVAKKKHAIDELAKIEKKFKIFREKLCDEQIAQYEQELEMLRQPSCVHPEYLAMIKCIDDRRAEKIAYEKTLLGYKQRTLERVTEAQRHQLHSQYFQTVRDVREQILSECNQRIFELQRGRRQLGVDEVEYMMKLPEKRSDQIRQQAAYNLEVSILAGVAKYVGFPAAPEIKPARPSEIEEDLRAMKIATRPTAPPPYVRPAYGRTSTADEAAAEEQFLERTPWANPQHPAHQQSHYGVAPAPPRVPSYHTPVGQRRLDAPNGSASTIEANSNPPSSTAGALHNGRIGESESPVLQMKRHPSDPPPYSETPRNIASLARESYAMSSPVGVPLEPQSDEQALRWGGSGVRSLNTSTSAAIPGRPDSTRIPLSQRSGLGTVSVGSGNGLFGR
ncbi:hypothetical protein BU26DRAFT_515387 [Trematosphaeria pertusa]|uniref:Transcriptional regulatory protein DEP1 n=1 Tax=Trematosphaeria pertusa TaxID=390896 RepID=A0A6A6ISB0_9PLEO|nr:uncharacterized protein BU26DRAFT_515387 [Trematosphaeria pertusa]KAF2253007.1 hypothetical protein BU26DRAFT_515387 [Trematosphaeria pertusa]